MSGNGRPGDLSGGNPLARRRALGAELRRLRLGRALTAEQAARAIDRSGSWISRLESGKVGIRPRELHDLLDVYGVTGGSRRDRLELLAVSGRERAWWSAYRDVVTESFAVFIGIEDSAESIFEYQERVIPGLLQTESYMRALFNRYAAVPEWGIAAAEIDRRIEVRLARQEILDRPRPPRLTVVIDESVVRRTVGGREIQRTQLRRLLDSIERGVDVRVLSFDSPAGPPVVPSFAILRSHAGSETACSETRDRAVTYDGDLASPYVTIGRWLLSVALSSRNSERLIVEALSDMGV
ncbi:hypothetical protein JCM9534A_68170 [Catenuloplanes indicus JCM 9534]